MVYWTCSAARGSATESEQAQVDHDCAPHLRQGFDLLTETFTSARDGAAPLDTPSYDDESTYLRIAEQLGPSEQAAAELLLSELRGKRSLEHTRADVTEQLREDSPSFMDVLMQCDGSLKLLGEIDSDFGRRSAREAAKLCYLDLGQAVLASDRVARMSFCSFEVEYIIEGVAAHALAGENPAVDQMIAKLRAEKGCE